MFFLYTSNRTEQLVGSLSLVVESTHAPSLFQQEIFLVQSRSMELMLSQHLTERFGVWGNSCYLLPLQFVSFLERELEITVESGDYDREILVWKIELLLRNGLKKNAEQLLSYLQGDQQDLKRFQLARKLANLFDQYQILRPEILDLWKEGRCCTSEQSELWQKSLWCRLREQSGGSLHRGEVITRLIETLGDGRDVTAKLPSRLFVFGLHTMPPLFLDILNSLSARMDVHLFLLSPCALYWGDIESRRARVKRKMREAYSEGRVVSDVESGGHHPLLISLGRQGAHFQEILLDRVDYVDGPAEFIDPAVGKVDPSLLHRLQSDVLAGFPVQNDRDETGIENDGSIQICSCHSRMRELSVLKQYLLSWLYEDPGLKLHEIVVMAPDIQDYATMIPAVFDEIDHSIADRDTRRKNNYFDIFLKFLALYSGRFGLSDVLAVLEHEEVYRNFSLASADIDRVRHWLADAGIRWGLSVEQRRLDGFAPFDAGSWQTGLGRMLMGFAVDSDEIVDGILPYAQIEGGDGEILGGLCRFVECVERGYFAFKKDKKLEQWSSEFKEFCSDLFGGNESPDLLALLRTISDLKDKYAPVHNEPVSFKVVAHWMESAGKTVSRGGFLSGRLTFCSMLPMRSIPFRVICLLGLNDDEFPRNDSYTPFDLMRANYRQGDRSQRDDDRYQFLEAIISARERLYLSYLGQSIRTNETIPPSVVISELIEVVGHSYKITDLVIEHPLQGFNSAYFGGDERLFSYSEHDCRVSAALLRSPADGKVWTDMHADGCPMETIEFQQLLDFYSNPQRFFLTNIVGVNLSEREEQPENSEPFELDNLQLYLAGNGVVDALLKKEDPIILAEKLQAALQWPLGIPGMLAYKGLLKETRIFAGQINELDLGERLEELPFTLDLSGYRVSGVLSHRYRKGQLIYRFANLKGRDLILARLHHLVSAQVQNHPHPTWMLAKDSHAIFYPENDAAAELEYFVGLYQRGCEQPSSLLIEPAFRYAQQVMKNKGTGRTEPIEAAAKYFNEAIEKRYDQAWELLYRNMNPVDILGEEFVRICEELIVPLLEKIRVE